MNPAPPIEAYKSEKSAFETKKDIKHYRDELRNLELKLGVVLKKGGAG